MNKPSRVLILIEKNKTLEVPEALIVVVAPLPDEVSVRRDAADDVMRHG